MVLDTIFFVYLQYIARGVLQNLPQSTKKAEEYDKYKPKNS